MPSLITIKRCTDPIEAHIVAGRLEAEGIRAFVAHEHHIWANWFMSNALQGVKVQVASDHAAEASQVLVRLRAGEFADIDGPAVVAVDEASSAKHEPASNRKCVN